VQIQVPEPRAEGRSETVLSLIVPFLNEREALPACLDRLERVLVELGESAEIVLVDDGSTDGSAAVVAARRPGPADVRLLRLSRNFGKEAAMTAGLMHARGQAVILLDADLQDPPELVPAMLEHWRDGIDVVLMQRRSRAGESLFKRASAHAFYRLLQWLSPAPIPVDTGDFRLMSRRAVDALLRLPERNRYMKGLYAWIGMSTVTLPYDRAARAVGRSKWNYPRLVGLAIEGIASFSVVPLRLALVTGALTALAGGAFGAWIIAKALILGDPVQGYPSLVALITLLGGTQLLGIGVVGEYVGKTYMEAKQRPLYVLLDEIWQRAQPIASHQERRHG
jgi:glycosyltransferase involved in cell wall biosynthesis